MPIATPKNPFHSGLAQSDIQKFTSLGDHLRNLKINEHHDGFKGWIDHLYEKKIGLVSPTIPDAYVAKVKKIQIAARTGRSPIRAEESNFLRELNTSTVCQTESDFEKFADFVHQWVFIEYARKSLPERTSITTEEYQRHVTHTHTTLKYTRDQAAWLVWNWADSNGIDIIEPAPPPPPPPPPPPTTTTTTTPTPPPAVPPPPTAPLLGKPTAVSSTQINLSWSAVPTATSYTIQRQTARHSTWVQLTTVLASGTGRSVEYSDTGLSPDTTYFYQVNVTNHRGTSNWSNIQHATIKSGWTHLNEWLRFFDKAALLSFGVVLMISILIAASIILTLRNDPREEIVGTWRQTIYGAHNPQGLAIRDFTVLFDRETESYTMTARTLSNIRMRRSREPVQPPTIDNSSIRYDGTTWSFKADALYHGAFNFRRVNANTFECSTGQHRLVRLRNPRLPTPDIREISAIGSTDIRVVLRAVRNSEEYVIQWATDSAFTTASSETVRFNSRRDPIRLTIPRLSPNTTYFVRVMATSTDNFSNSHYSTVRSVTTAPARQTATPAPTRPTPPTARPAPVATPGAAGAGQRGGSGTLARPTTARPQTATVPTTTHTGREEQIRGEAEEAAAAAREEERRIIGEIGRFVAREVPEGQRRPVIDGSGRVIGWQRSVMDDQGNVIRWERAVMDTQGDVRWEYE